MLRRAAKEDLPHVVALQRAAYAKNRPILGVEPLPLTVDYDEIFRTMEVWLDDDGSSLAGVLILQSRADDLLIWSIATDPSLPSTGRGRRLLLAAEARAVELGHKMLRLYTGSKLVDRVAWYSRHGYAVERIEVMPDRSITHMMKALDNSI